MDQTTSPVLTLVFRPLPIPPYPGVIPYTVDQAEESQNTSGGEQLLTSPRLLGIEHRPVSVGSFGPPSNQTVPGLAAGTLSEEQVRDKFYAYWTRQKVRALIGLRYLTLPPPGRWMFSTPPGAWSNFVLLSGV